MSKITLETVKNKSPAVDRVALAKKSRLKGHTLERKDVLFLKGKYPHIATSRSESKRMDDNKVDIVGTEEKSFPYLWQCKSGYAVGINYEVLINEIRVLNPIKSKTMPIIVHHKWGGKNMEDVLLMTLSDLMKIAGKNYKDLIVAIPWKSIKQII